MAAPIAAIGLGATIAGGITSAAGASLSSASQQQMYNYQAGVAQINAQISLQNRDYAVQQGEQQAATYGLQAKQRMGEITVAQASSGLDINSGSAVKVREGQEQMTNRDLTLIRSNAAKVAYDYDVQSVQFENQAQLYQMAGTNANQAGQISATASILGTASSVASKWTSAGYAGLFSSNTSLGT